ncbi:MAG TPA: hypothetical protein VGO60_12330 [Iamia sp.]|jgi:hypothetical protein|nr:hypothetical protein [Iamia sp.]
MGQAFRDLDVDEKEQAMRRLGQAGLLEWDAERTWRTPAGHATMARITAAGERRGWAGYRRWIGALLYAELDARRSTSREGSSPGEAAPDLGER